MRKLTNLLTWIVAAQAVVATCLMAQQSSGSLQLALDRPVEFAIQDATIGQVFSRLSAVTGLKFVVAEETLECLPYGEQTRLSVKLKNVTVRNALGRMLAPQAMRWEVGDDEVRIIPTAPLSRMCRRATYEELKLLGSFFSARLLPSGAEAGDLLGQLRKATQAPDLDIVFHVDADKAAALTGAERVLPAAPAAWLDMLCHGQGWVWYLWGDQIVVLDKAAQVARQLQRQISLRYQNAKLIDVLRDLARKGRVNLTMAPGVMNYLPFEARTNFTMMMADASIVQVLELISGQTGLEFTTDAKGIHVEASEKLIAGLEAMRSRSRSPFFVKMSLPGPAGANFEIFFRAEELPEGLVEAIQAQKNDLIQKLTDQYFPPALSDE